MRTEAADIVRVDFCEEILEIGQFVFSQFNPAVRVAINVDVRIFRKVGVIDSEDGISVSIDREERVETAMSERIEFRSACRECIVQRDGFFRASEPRKTVVIATAESHVVVAVCIERLDGFRIDGNLVITAARSLCLSTRDVVVIDLVIFRSITRRDNQTVSGIVKSHIDFAVLPAGRIERIESAPPRRGIVLDASDIRLTADRSDPRHRRIVRLGVDPEFEHRKVRSESRTEFCPRSGRTGRLIDMSLCIRRSDEGKVEIVVAVTCHVKRLGLDIRHVRTSKCRPGCSRSIPIFRCDRAVFLHVSDNKTILAVSERGTVLVRTLFKN